VSCTAAALSPVPQCCQPQHGSCVLLGLLAEMHRGSDGVSQLFIEVSMAVAAVACCAVTLCMIEGVVANQ
jgi:hypothetical protein